VCDVLGGDGWFWWRTRETFVERRKIIVRVELRDGRNGERKWQRERGFSSLFCTKKKAQLNGREN
jgi:hypothetical protein